MEEAQKTLANRPDLEHVVEKYQEMLADIREALRNELGAEPWINEHSEGEAFCAEPFDVTEGQIRTLTTWTYEDNIPDSEWARASDVVTAVTAKYGFEPPQAVYDEPGNHLITADDKYGATYDFGTAVNTTLGMSTGCHLPQAKHPDSPSTAAQASAPVPEWVPAKNDPHGITWLPGRPHTS